MDEYIKKSDALKIMLNAMCGTGYQSRAMSAIDDTPTADVQEVRHGEWIYRIDDLFPADSTKECNQCHARQNLFCDDEYCPHCGAKMDGKENEDAEVH